MSLTINTNLSSLIAQSSLINSTSSLNQAIERMSTGFKINHAKDNAAGYSIKTNLSTKINAYSVAEDNASLGLEMVLTASSSLSMMADLTSRLRSLAEQAHNGTYGADSLNAIDLEAQSIITELYRIKETASYNGIKLFNDFNNTVPSFSDGSQLVPNAQGFLKEIVVRDTSTMDRLEDVDSNIELTGGTYSISTEAEFVKLAQMANAGKITGSCEFVLANDIDISNYCKSNLDSKGEGGWRPINGAVDSVLDGNSYTISGLYINRPNSDYQALIGSQSSIKVKNLGLINPNVIGRNFVGALRGAGHYKFTENCYVEGGVIQGKINVGGLVGHLNYDTASYCYTTCDVIGVEKVGGIAGLANYHDGVINNYATGNISGDNKVGGILGDGFKLEKAAFYGTVNGVSDVGIIAGKASVVKDCFYNINVNKDYGIVGENYQSAQITNVIGVNFGKKISLQVGIDSSENSRLSFEAWFALDDLARLKNSSMSDLNVFRYIDNILTQINAKQTEYGTVQNRLESVMEQITISYENLLSTRSTISDADIAEESSAYIRNQILQQASATLLATANQNPSIALQLL